MEQVKNLTDQELELLRIKQLAEAQKSQINSGTAQFNGTTHLDHLNIANQRPIFG